jgi:hypothetical protein
MIHILRSWQLIIKKGWLFAFSKKMCMMGLPVQTAMIIDDEDDLGHLLTVILESRKIPGLS